ncbi:DUF885 domain-containing protein [Amycolatopsis jejuensis]|uniref:DUF885 domain-containing protein n=1 Tax=Amycolatopsis jejuensis TaxID=330084 RepID=UPI000523FA9D|nr:DUF885 domain-containing protein [Amycolatopsis jejuensis]
MTRQPFRTRTAVDDLMDRYLDQYVALDPLTATRLGVPGHDDALPDLSPDGLAEVSALRRQTLAKLRTAAAADRTDEITIAAAIEQLSVAEAIRATGGEESRLGSVVSPVQELEGVFSSMAADTADEWATIAARLNRLPEAIRGYRASLQLAATRGDVSARRQVLAAASQADESAGPDGYFATLGSDVAARTELPASVRTEVGKGVQAAREAYAQLGSYLRDELLDLAPDTDPVGPERYALHSRFMLGAQIDLAETYAWGQEELSRITALMRETAHRVKPDASVAEAITHLDNDPAYQVTGIDGYRTWMQEKVDAAVSALAGTHFDIPEPLRRLDCLVSPMRIGGMSYSDPSEDFSRPGQIWWSPPAGTDTFSTWRDLTILYHEGVPGHHLQMGHAVVQRALLNNWRRRACQFPGHTEGWGLYAERLMADLGYLDDPAYAFGMLNSQSLRATRVVVDIGWHCGFEAPAEVGGGTWTYEKAWQFLTAHASMPETFLRFELDRYLGCPGQAPCYKIGERLWLQLREEARRSEGDTFDLAGFHRRALDIGAVGLDVLRDAVLTGSHCGRSE